VGTHKLPPLPDEGTMADLEDMDRRLTGLMQPLLLGRLPSEALHRWARLRYWVASAQEDDWLLPLDVMYAGVENLVAVVEERCNSTRCTGTPAIGNGID
jgi:hypothetical protein